MTFVFCIPAPFISVCSASFSNSNMFSALFNCAMFPRSFHPRLVFPRFSPDPHYSFYPPATCFRTRFTYNILWVACVPTPFSKDHLPAFFALLSDWLTIIQSLSRMVLSLEMKDIFMLFSSVLGNSAKFQKSNCCETGYLRLAQMLCSSVLDRFVRD